MRIPIAVNVAPFDLEGVQSRIDGVRSAFVTYLQGVRTKPGSSKHSLMGPIGKILSELRNGRRDPASLKGYTLRVQDQSGTKPTLETLQALESGISLLTKLLSEVPLAYHDQLLDRLDYGIYFDLQKNRLLQREIVRKRWHEFLIAKYGSVEMISASWEEPITCLEDIPLFRKISGEKGKKDSAKKSDIRGFWTTGSSDLVDEEE